MARGEGSTPMKAIRAHQFGGPEVLRLEDAPDPQVQGGQVQIRVRAAGINPADLVRLSGRLGQIIGRMRS